jgi:high affinity Mn2+ porin
MQPFVFSRSIVTSLNLLGYCLVIISSSAVCPAQDAPSNSPATPPVVQTSNDQPQTWNWHVQNTDIIQGHPNFPAQYSGPNSLGNGNQLQNTVSVDLYGGLRLWQGAEVHVDGLVWQGYGLSNTLGAEAFPNGEAQHAGTQSPNFNLAHVIFRQTIGLGGEQEDISDDQLTLAGKQDVSRLTITVGRMSPTDIFDNNTYAGNSRTQFMNWALIANEAWDASSDALGFITGETIELNQPSWAIRYGLFQVTQVANGKGTDQHLLDAWDMVTELEQRYDISGHPGKARVLAYLNHSPMGSYEEAVDSGVQPATFPATANYRFKFGVGLNLEQELTQDIGAFSRLGWSNGQAQAWGFSDVDYAASLGLSIKGTSWSRPDDTIGLAGVYSGISKIHQQFLADGGTGILAGDGALSYGGEEATEAYYNFQIRDGINFTADIQFINNPAFNTARGPVFVFGARLHFEY